MAAPSALTLNYDSVLSTTLFNLNKMIQDEISTTNAFMFVVMKKNDAYEAESSIGDRIAIPLMYELGVADSYSGYDTLSTNPTDGITTAFFDWRQMSIPIAISGFEEEKNTGEAQIVDLMEAKTKQAVLGIQDLWGRALLRGNVENGGSIEAARVSPSNTSSFIDPLFLFLKKDPTTSTVVGNINQSTSSWWRNQKLDMNASTYVGFLKQLRNLNNLCSKGPGGVPDLHLTTQGTYELYEAALAAAHRNPDYQKADIPFDNIAFKGNPVVWDEFTPDVQNGTVAITKGTWAMINSKYFKIKYNRRRNFKNTPFMKPVNQDAKVAHILWFGAATVSNRRKHGVGFDIDETIAS